MTTTHDTDCVICHLQHQETQDRFTQAMAEATITVYQPAKKDTMNTVTSVYLVFLFVGVMCAAYGWLTARRRP